MIVFVLGALGFALIAGAMRRYQTLLPKLKTHRRALLCAGWACLTASLIVALTQPHAPIALVGWFGLMTVAPLPAVAAVTILTNRKSKNAR